MCSGPSRRNLAAASYEYGSRFVPVEAQNADSWVAACNPSGGGGRTYEHFLQCGGDALRRLHRAHVPDAVEHHVPRVGKSLEQLHLPLEGADSV